jgi:hypothetical protein
MSDLGYAGPHFPSSGVLAINIRHSQIVNTSSIMKTMRHPEVDPTNFARTALLRLEDELSQRGIGCHNVRYPEVGGSTAPKSVFGVDFEIPEHDRQLPFEEIEARYLQSAVAVLANQIETLYTGRSPFRCEPMDLPHGMRWSESVTSRNMAIMVVAAITRTKRGTIRKRHPFPYQVRIEVAEAQVQ